MPRSHRLGATKRLHSVEVENASATLRSSINKGVDALRRGSCHGAQGFITAAYQAMGSMKAHGQSGGQTAWLPQRALMDLNGKFNDLCLVADKVDVGVHWSPALAGRRGRRR